MKYRQLGRTGLDVSVLSFGASSLGLYFVKRTKQKAFAPFIPR
jgi:aryl-alcohol dehydrogenase-like predicted oxidoreductase